jgi:hypothetical protein
MERAQELQPSKLREQQADTIQAEYEAGIKELEFKAADLLFDYNIMDRMSEILTKEEERGLKLKIKQGEIDAIQIANLIAENKADIVSRLIESGNPKSVLLAADITNGHSVAEHIAQGKPATPEEMANLAASRSPELMSILATDGITEQNRPYVMDLIRIHTDPAYLQYAFDRPLGSMRLELAEIKEKRRENIVAPTPEQLIAEMQKPLIDEEIREYLPFAIEAAAEHYRAIKDDPEALKAFKKYVVQEGIIDIVGPKYTRAVFMPFSDKLMYGPIGKLKGRMPKYVEPFPKAMTMKEVLEAIKRAAEIQEKFEKNLPGVLGYAP